MRRKRRDILELAEDRMKSPIPVKKVRRTRGKVEELTKRQIECLRMIKVFMKVRGFTPSLQEIAESMGLKSRANILRIVGELKRKGKLTIKPYLARTIKLRNE